MEKLDEVLSLLRTATPLLQEFAEWKKEEAVRQKAYEQEQTESQKEFEKWLATKKAEEAQEEKDAKELARHFYGGEAWEQEHNCPKRY